MTNLTHKAAALSDSMAPDEALSLWLSHAVAFVRSDNGVVVVMTAALDDADSALHASCTSLRAAGTRLLEQTRTEGTARADRLVDTVSGAILQNGKWTPRTVWGVPIRTGGRPVNGR